MCVCGGGEGGFTILLPGLNPTLITIGPSTTEVHTHTHSLSLSLSLTLSHTHTHTHTHSHTASKPQRLYSYINQSGGPNEEKDDKPATSSGVGEAVKGWRGVSGASQIDKARVIGVKSGPVNSPSQNKDQEVSITMYTCTCT